MQDQKERKIATLINGYKPSGKVKKQLNDPKIIKISIKGDGNRVVFKK